ncbi:MAG: hypothetical protein QG635_1614, partial [Bacteroidota bacterium]|nr:hypothetical protein [Bacteroidota bacterium]
NWMLYVVGAVVAILLNSLGISPLAFALGMYLPQHLNTPLLIGGLLSYFVKKSSKDEALAKARDQRGTLISSGFIAGAAIFGVLGAFLKYIFSFWNIESFAFFKGWDETWGAEVLAIGMFGVLLLFWIWSISRAKKDE